MQYNLDDDTLSYMSSLNNLQQNPKNKQPFSAKQIAHSAFDVALAQKTLTEEELNLVFGIYSFYASADHPLLLNLDEWREMMNDVISAYDLVAPYYKFSGFNIATTIETERQKTPYRENAKQLIFNNQFATREWAKLLNEFQIKFGKTL